MMAQGDLSANNKDDQEPNDNDSNVQVKEEKTEVKDPKWYMNSEIKKEEQHIMTSSLPKKE